MVIMESLEMRKRLCCDSMEWELHILKILMIIMIIQAKDSIELHTVYNYFGKIFLQLAHWQAFFLGKIIQMDELVNFDLIIRWTAELLFCKEPSTEN